MKAVLKKFLVLLGLREKRVPPNAIIKSIQGESNRIRHKGADLNSVRFDIVGKGNTIRIAPGCFLRNVTFHVRGDNHRVHIRRNCRFGGGGNIWLEGESCVLKIGRNSTFENVHLALTERGSKISIGRDCMFAYSIEVRNGDSHSIIARDSKKRLNYAKDVSIGDHVWVAAHCIILKGVSIAADSIVATGSVVTKSFEEQGIVIGGNPARKLKEGVTWSRKRLP